MQVPPPGVALLMALQLLSLLLWRLLPGRVLARHAQVSVDSASRPWTLVAAGFSDGRLLPTLRSLAITMWLGPSVEQRCGSLMVVLLFVAGV